MLYDALNAQIECFIIFGAYSKIDQILILQSLNSIFR